MFSASISLKFRFPDVFTYESSNQERKLIWRCSPFSKKFEGVVFILFSSNKQSACYHAVFSQYMLHSSAGTNGNEHDFPKGYRNFYSEND